jgi:hypothetical protein
LYFDLSSFISSLFVFSSIIYRCCGCRQQHNWILLVLFFGILNVALLLSVNQCHQ